MAWPVISRCFAPMACNFQIYHNKSIINYQYFQVDDKYYVGVLLAVTSCFSGGLMNVLVSSCKHVSNSVLVNWSAIAGLVMSIIYCFTIDTSYILSYRIFYTTWTQWATFVGKLKSFRFGDTIELIQIYDVLNYSDLHFFCQL